MNKFFSFTLHFCFVVIASINLIHADKQSMEEFFPISEIVTFQPPQGWKNADVKELAPHIKALVIGPTKNHLPPSINLATESYAGSLKDYLKIARSIGEKKGSIWKDLGPFTTQAGEGRLAQLDTTSEWGDLRMLHVILVKNEVVYILTASALKAEFSSFYKDFFEALKSLQIKPSP